MPKAIPIDDPEILDKIRKTVIYHNRHFADLKRILNSLAVKMGIDPAHDVVFVAKKWTVARKLSLRDFPNWLMPTELIDSGFLIKRGVRNPETK